MDDEVPKLEAAQIQQFYSQAMLLLSLSIEDWVSRALEGDCATIFFSPQAEISGFFSIQKIDIHHCHHF